MNWTIFWSAAGVVITLIVHAIIIVRGWTIIEMRLGEMTRAFSNMNDSLKKRDERLDAAFVKIDDHEHRVTVIESKCSVEIARREK